MKIKNKDLRAISIALFSLGNHQEDIALKWEITKFAKKVNDANEVLKSQVNVLIDEQGVEKDGNKSISSNNKDYMKLMELDIDVDIDEGKFYLSYLEQFNPTVQELMSLGPIIKEGD